MYFNIVEVRYVREYVMQITFADGNKGNVDLWEYIQEGELFEPLKDIDVFKNVAIEFGTLTWENGQIDLAPEPLYEKCTGTSILFPSIGDVKAG